MMMSDALQLQSLLLRMMSGHDVIEDDEGAITIARREH